MEKRVVVSADCVCDLPLEMQKKYRIPIMYYYVRTEEGRFQDTKEISANNLIAYLEKGKHASSEATTVEKYVQFFEELQKKYPKRPIIHICLANKVSDAYEVATKAAQGMEQIYVVNSGHLSGGMGIMVLAAADMAERGAVCEMILTELEQLKERVSCSFVIYSTKLLHRNGRIDSKVHRLCHLLLAHPILEMRDSRMIPVGVCVGKQRKCAKKYLRRLLRKKKQVNSDIVFLMTAGCTYEFQQYLKQELERLIPWKRIIVHVASATVSSNCGEGTFGIMFVRQGK